MQGIGLNVPPSATAHAMDEALAAIERIGLPVVIRPAFILGGKGTGIATTPAVFERVASTGLACSGATMAAGPGNQSASRAG